jgi:hypothetical protein
LGIIYNNAFWVFYSSSQPIEHLPPLKGKRIAVRPVGSEPPDRPLKEFWAWPELRNQPQHS